MKAAVCTKYGPPEVLLIADVKTPTPKNNEVRIRIHATAVTGSDVIVRGFKISKPVMWLLGRLVLGITKPRNPILGFLLAGEVESVGKDVRRFKKGDQVFGTTIKTPTQPRPGTYAEYKCLPEDSVITTKPSNITFEEAVAIPYGGSIALHFLRKGGIRAGQKVLVYGASGAIGTSAVQLAKHFGANVTGVCSTNNLELVKSLGADALIDYTREDIVCQGRLYDLILDAVPAHKNDRKALRSRCKQVLAPTGKYVNIDDGRPDMGIESLILLKELVETGRIRPVIDRCYPLEEIAEAHRYVDTGRKRGTVVVTMQAGRTQST